MMKWLELAGLPIAWGGILLGVLSLHEGDVANQHSVCGPWGCGPPTSTLVAIHLGWVVALLPPMLYLPFRLNLSAGRVRLLSRFALMFGVVGIAGIFLWQWLVWYPEASEYHRRYIWQRCGFLVAVATDWPLVQMIIAGSTLLVWNRFRRNSDRETIVGESTESAGDLSA